MSVHLVGGGRDLDLASIVYGRFVEEASTHASGGTPRVAVVVVAEAADLPGGVAWFGEALARCAAVEVLAMTATEDGAGLRGADGAPVPASSFAALDGLLVGGGLTPAYHRVLLPYATAVRAAVRGGLPYAGFSAGAMVAPDRALLGGWRLGGIAVTAEDNAEDLDQLTVVDGLGLLDTTVEVHTAQWGTLSRIVAAVAGGVVPRGMAIDENTVVILDPTGDTSTASVSGSGQAWFVEDRGGRVSVERRPGG